MALVVGPYILFLEYLPNTYPKGVADPVTISYDELIDAPDTLVESISRAFGSDPDALGILVVTQLPPEYPGLRERLLKLANKFGSLDESVRCKYSDAGSNYSFGWSWGKEIMNGAPGKFPLYVHSYIRII